MLKLLTSQKRESNMGARYKAQLTIKARNSEFADLYSVEGSVEAETLGKLMTLMVEEAAALQVQMKFWEFLQPHPETIRWLSSIYMTPIIPNHKLYKDSEAMVSAMSACTVGRLGFLEFAELSVKVLYSSTETRLNNFGLNLHSPFGHGKEEHWDTLFEQAEATGALKALKDRDEIEAIWEASIALAEPETVIVEPIPATPKRFSLRKFFSK